MGIQSSNFLVNRDDQQFRCLGTELKTKLRQDDILLLQRDGLQYGFKLPLNLDVISSVSTVTVNLNYEQYAYVRDRDTGQKLAETSPPFADAQADRRVYSRLFDGDANSVFKSYTNNGIRHELVVEFPEPIDVYGSIEIMAGFHSNKRLGQMLINGVIVKEISAWDDQPEIFRVNYTGQVKEFSIRQKELNGTQCTSSISYITIDGLKLKSNVTTTRLTLAQDTDMSKYKVNTRVKQFSGNVTGVIGSVDESNRTLTLTTTDPFQASNEILIDQIDGNPVSLPEILDTDLLVCTDVNDITYKVSGANFKSLFVSLPDLEQDLGYADTAYNSSVTGTGTQADPYKFSSTNIGIDNTNSDIKFLCNVSGTIHCKGYVSSERYDFFRFKLNGVTQFEKAGASRSEFTVTFDHQQAVTAGDNVRVLYVKDGSSRVGEDRVVIEELYVVPTP